MSAGPGQPDLDALEAVLDDPEELAARDRGGLLRALATAGAQVRSAATHAGEAGLATFAADGRPRAVVLAGMGGAGQAAGLLAAVAGGACPLPLVLVREPVLPGWVGSMDVVIGLSSSGRAWETLAVADEAARRGARLLTVGPAASPLAARAEQNRGVHLAAEVQSQPDQAALWALSVPLLLAGDALGLITLGSGVGALGAPERLADRLDAEAAGCGPAREMVVNGAKALAAELSATLPRPPLIWGSGAIASFVAQRFATQLALSPKLPALAGALPDVAHSQFAVLDGALGTCGRPARAGGGTDADDFFRDRVEEPGEVQLRVVLLRDSGEHPRIAAGAAAVADVAGVRGIPVRELRAEGAPLEQLASLVAITDFASVYLALALGIDPMPTGAVAELKERVAG